MLECGYNFSSKKNTTAQVDDNSYWCLNNLTVPSPPQDKNPSTVGWTSVTAACCNQEVGV
jgi:hypothetical protein